MSKEVVSVFMRVAGPGAAAFIAGGAAGYFGGEWLENQFNALPDETSFALAMALGVLGAIFATKYVGLPMYHGWYDKTYGSAV